MLRRFILAIATIAALNAPLCVTGASAAWHGHTGPHWSGGSHHWSGGGRHWGGWGGGWYGGGWGDNGDYVAGMIAGAVIAGIIASSYYYHHHHYHC